MIKHFVLFNISQLGLRAKVSRFFVLSGKVYA
jgi:hypothetical protein